MDKLILGILIPKITISHAQHGHIENQAVLDQELQEQE
jgi:hypothetical protein